MRHFLSGLGLRPLLGVGALVVLAACADTPPDLTSPDVAANVRPTNTPGTCVTPQALEGRVNAAFGAGSPDANAVIGRVRTMVRAVQRNNLPQAQGLANNIVDFVARKNDQSPLPGGQAAVENLVIGVYCFVGLGDPGANPDNSILIMPDDQPQVLLGTGGQSGIRFDANPVAEPTLVTITTLTPPAPNAPPILLTKLDQYPGYVNIVKTSPNNLPLAKPVIVEICPTVAIPAEVLQRARLGHQRAPGAAGFEVKPSGGNGILTCANVADARSSFRRALDGVLEATLFPKVANAALFGGGITGNVNEFSPFGIVDPVLSFGGGITGNVNEFRLEGGRTAGVNLSMGQQAGPCANGQIVGTAGQPLPQECRPQIRITTRNGTPFANVPVTWTTLPGDNGTIAPFTAAGCGTFGSPFTVGTGAAGYARACWTLGQTVGPQQLRATVQLGGEANSPEIVFEPATLLFTATAQAPVPTQLVFQQQPPAGGQVPRASTVTAQVRVADAGGNTVADFTGPVSVSLSAGTGATLVTVTQNAVAGVATLTVPIPGSLGGPARLTATATLPGGVVTITGNEFTVTP